MFSEHQRHGRLGARIIPADGGDVTRVVAYIRDEYRFARAGYEGNPAGSVEGILADMLRRTAGAQRDLAALAQEDLHPLDAQPGRGEAEDFIQQLLWIEDRRHGARDVANRLQLLGAPLSIWQV